MQWKSDEFSEYGESPPGNSYSDPSYYQPFTPSLSHATRPLESFAPYSEYVELPAAEVERHYVAEPMIEYGEYRGPSSVEGYTADPGAEQREAAKNGTANGNRKKKLAGLGGIGATLVALLLKIKTVLVLLFDIKWVAFLFKFGWAGISAFVSIVLYSYIFGLPFAIGLVALLFIHEMGHAVVMKLKGIPVGGLIFIPMLGAAVLMRQMPKNAKDEAEVGIAGPFAGAVASSVCLLIAMQHPGVSSIWAPLAYFGFFINLFNLIPIVPFDGGRVLAAIDRRIWIVGFLGLVAFEVWSMFNGNFSIWLTFFIVIAAGQFWSRNKTAKSPEAKAYYDVPISERVILTLLYFGLAAVLAIGMSISHNMIFSFVQ